MKVACDGGGGPLGCAVISIPLLTRIDGIDIYDTHAVACDYRNGVIMNYSLIAYSPWEGFRVAITGTVWEATSSG